MKKHSIGIFLGSIILGAALASPLLGVAASPGIDIVDVSRLAVSNAQTQARPRIDRSQFPNSGSVEIIVQLSDPPLAVANGPESRRVGGLLGRPQQMAHSAMVRQRQDAVVSKIVALGGKEIGRVRIAYNAAIMRVDASKLTQIASLPGVVTVQPPGKFRLSLSTTVPYIGASSAQAVGLDGFGVKVAVLDTGIDYTHRNLGGAGTGAAYLGAYGTDPSDPKNTTRDGLFPTAKVIEGFDFVGEVWPDCPSADDCRTEDPDPIDFNGHGTHVADIVGGKSQDGNHVGVAPETSLLAVKVCSAVSTACNGVAILKALDYVLDPNGDGSMDDAVDVVNMSLGADYGQRENSTSEAAANAVRAGVVVVAAAGNAARSPVHRGLTFDDAGSDQRRSDAGTDRGWYSARRQFAAGDCRDLSEYSHTRFRAHSATARPATSSFLGTGCVLTLGETYPSQPGRQDRADRPRVPATISEKVRRQPRTQAPTVS